MERYQKIHKHPVYQKMIENIEKAEENRVFCLHGTEHALDTARIAYIIALEERFDIKKDIIYAAALLHDIGRYSNKEHNVRSAEIVSELMPECGYTAEETAIVAEAVRMHRTDNGDGLAAILYRADKLSRNCFHCKAVRDCYWADEKRNKNIVY